MPERNNAVPSINELLWSFILYGCFGWVIEMIICGIEVGEIVDRGFLNIPHCPVYGFGIIFLLLIFGRLKDRPVVLFFASALLINALELFTGLAMEAMFDKRWWDYSHHFLNYKGFITLPIGILWGLACVAVIRFVQPRLSRQIARIDPWLNKRILVFFFTVFAVDNFRVFYDLLSAN